MMRELGSHLLQVKLAKLTSNKIVLSAAVSWRKVMLVFFVIFELGPNPCELLYHLNQSGVGLRHFFTLKIDSEVLGTKKEKKVIMVLLIAPR